MRPSNHRKRDQIVTELTRIPAVLYFPADVLGQLNELCALRCLTPAQLIAEAFASQGARFEQFVQELLTPQEPGQPRNLAGGSVVRLGARSDAPFHENLHYDAQGSRGV